MWRTKLNRRFVKMYKEYEILDIVDNIIGVNNLIANVYYDFYDYKSIGLSEWSYPFKDCARLSKENIFIIFNKILEKKFIKPNGKVTLFYDNKMDNFEIGYLYKTSIPRKDTWTNKKKHNALRWEFVGNIEVIKYEEYKNYKRTKLIDEIL